MRLWTLHPRYLDPPGLTALWREGLLAQQVLRGLTRGYRHHSQLQRFRAQPHPVAAMAVYLREVREEALRRGYRFDPARIAPDAMELAASVQAIAETDGQLLYEWRRLLERLQTRSPAMFEVDRGIACPQPHPLFRIVPGPVADWERV